jgi:aspartyl-tRNA(Asn)/glutamyl-tRNA(Gln) amidotransferase subunit A
LKNFSFPEIQRDLRAGATSCVDRVLFHLAQIRDNTHLNAFLSVYEEEALARAAAIDKKIKNSSAGKLAGMVIGLKDVICYKDHPLQAGSKILDRFQSQFNATAVQRLLDEDAIIIGRQNCDEFAMGSSNENSAFGPTLNPIDNSRVPGGSSGGSAVAVKADMCQVSIGSDTGGSVRQPAAFCGVFGLKPTYARVSRYGLVAYGSSLDCIGVFAKNPSDIGLVLEVIAGADEYDSTVSQQPVSSYSIADQTFKKARVACISETIDSPGLQPEIKSSVIAAVDQLKTMGHTVERIEFPLLEYALPAYYILAMAEASANLSRYDGVRYGYCSPDANDLASMYKKTRSEGFGREVQRRILLGTFVLTSNYHDAYYTKAQKVRRIIREKTKAIFRDYDFILMPTAPTTAFKLGQLTGDPLAMYLADLYSVHANIVGAPAISFPYGTDKAGLPIGLQLVADDFAEAKLLQLAAQLGSNA